MQDLLNSIEDLHHKVESLTEAVALLMKERKPEPDKPVEALAPKPQIGCWACGDTDEKDLQYRWLETTYYMPTLFGMKTEVTVCAPFCHRFPCYQRALEFSRENEGINIVYNK